ncbi:hypothetical protein Syun_026802 [Stephania yunnanensis]|uniref:Uncharacterized protein n=1 Tax=Stephania yunnanensis TaxID=152371 RepID=A0AAP0HPK8_9MAGN
MNSRLNSESGSVRKDYQYYSNFPVEGFNEMVGYSSMQVQAQGSSGLPHNVYGQPVQESNFQYFANDSQLLEALDHYLSSDESSQGLHVPTHASSEQFCNLDSSSATEGYAVYNSPSTVSFSPNGSPQSQQEYQSYPSDVHCSPHNIYGSPMSASCVTDNCHDFRNKLRELETEMLGSDIFDGIDSSFHGGAHHGLSEQDKWKQVTDAINRGDLKSVLIACAEAVSDNNLMVANSLIAELRKMVSVSGEPLQRLGAYMLEGLVARLASSGSLIYKSLRCKELKQPASAELLSYMRLLYDVCPFFKFGYMSANGAIAEAVKDECRIHIIDFQIAQGSQWITLIQALASRPGGPPCLRITGVDDSQSTHARGGGLDIVGRMLAKFAESHNVPFEFHSAAMSGSDVQLSNLAVRRGEAIVVNFPFVLHHMPDESVSTENHRDRLLRLVKSLSPKVVTLVEQESNTNTAPFLPRFIETLDYYTAMFESIDVTLPRDDKERINVEQHCLARDVVNIIACEGADRVERHELLGKWKSRFLMAGFTPFPLSSVVNATIKTLMEKYSKFYTLEERDGALYLGWMNRKLVSSCAWR